MDTLTDNTLDSIFFALADPTRRAILADLREGTKTVTELAEPFEVTLPAITKHLKVLERAALIKRSRQAQYRPCTLQPEALQEVDAWMEAYREFFDESFRRLDAYLQVLQDKEEIDE